MFCVLSVILARQFTIIMLAETYTNIAYYVISRLLYMQQLSQRSSNKEFFV